MKHVILSIFTLFLFLEASAQNQLIVFFKDKESASKSSVIQFSERSIERRAKYNIPFDFKDLPVSKTYLNKIGKWGEIKAVSRWLNAALVNLTVSKEKLIKNHAFINKVIEIKPSNTSFVDKKEILNKSISYGATTQQITQLNLDCLHDLGFEGEGVYVGVIDAGFNNMDNINYFDSVYADNRVIETYDFVLNSTNVYGFSGHGTGVASCIVAQNTTPFVYYGTAVDVDIALYRSEDADTETIEEEFNLVAALERCDEQGVDIANVSLGYVNFDNPSDNHSYSDLDGETTIAAIGVNTAASKGIAVIAAAGNDGPATIGTPCDADSVLCVGAVDDNGDYAPFSSVGPSSDGQIKPDVVARGKDAAVVYDAGDVIAANGTSFASPIMSGAIACLMQAHPSRAPMEIFNAIRQSASQFLTPDNEMGYGVPDMCLANDILTATATVEKVDGLELTLFPNPAHEFITIKSTMKGEELSVEVVNTIGETVQAVTTKLTQGMSMVDVRFLSSGVYFLSLHVDGVYLTTEKIIVKH